MSQKKKEKNLLYFLIEGYKNLKHQINKMIENKCVLCNEHFEKGKMKQIKYDDPILNGNFIQSIGDYKNLKHQINYYYY